MALYRQNALKRKYELLRASQNNIALMIYYYSGSGEIDRAKGGVIMPDNSYLIQFVQFLYQVNLLLIAILLDKYFNDNDR